MAMPPTRGVGTWWNFWTPLGWSMVRWPCLCALNTRAWASPSETINVTATDERFNHPDYVNAHLMFPTGPESVRIVYDWLFEADRVPMNEADLELRLRRMNLDLITCKQVDRKQSRLTGGGKITREGPADMGRGIHREFDWAILQKRTPMRLLNPNQRLNGFIA